MGADSGKSTNNMLSYIEKNAPGGKVVYTKVNDKCFKIDPANDVADDEKYFGGICDKDKLTLYSYDKADTKCEKTATSVKELKWDTCQKDEVTLAAKSFGLAKFKWSTTQFNTGAAALRVAAVAAAAAL